MGGVAARRGLLVGSLAMAGLGAGCETAPPRSAAGPPLRRVDYLDIPAFDSQLRQAMRDGTERVVVRPARPLRTSDLPPRMEAWLSAVAERGGQVAVVSPQSVNPATGEQSRSIVAVLTLLNPLLEQAFASVRNRMEYAPAAGYDAQLVVAPGSDEVLGVVFRRRAP